MKPNILILFVLSASILLLSGCDKNKRIIKNLWKGNGIWHIEYYLESDSNNTNTTAYLDCGIFTFEENGWGNYIIEKGEITELQTFSFKVDGNLLSLFIGTETILYNLDWKKDNMEIYRPGKRFKLTKRE